MDYNEFRVTDLQAEKAQIIQNHRHSVACTFLGIDYIATNISHHACSITWNSFSNDILLLSLLSKI